MSGKVDQVTVWEVGTVLQLVRLAVYPNSLQFSHEEIRQKLWLGLIGILKALKFICGDAPAEDTLSELLIVQIPCDRSSAHK